jgi:hypothetical protein
VLEVGKEIVTCCVFRNLIGVVIQRSTLGASYRRGCWFIEESSILPPLVS